MKQVFKTPFEIEISRYPSGEISLTAEAINELWQELFPSVIRQAFLEFGKDRTFLSMVSVKAHGFIEIGFLPKEEN